MNNDIETKRECISPRLLSYLDYVSLVLFFMLAMLYDTLPSQFITIFILLGRSEEGKRRALISFHHLLCRLAQYSSKEELSFASGDWWQKALGKHVQQSSKQKNNETIWTIRS